VILVVLLLVLVFDDEPAEPCHVLATPDVAQHVDRWRDIPFLPVDGAAVHLNCKF
jgi:hypothetical protein